jgi:hypothetical protein
MVKEKDSFTIQALCEAAGITEHTFRTMLKNARGRQIDTKARDKAESVPKDWIITVAALHPLSTLSSTA